MAFEVTADDLFVVLRAAGVDTTLDKCESALDSLDLADVEQAALYGDDLDEQTHQEIHDQLVYRGLIERMPDVGVSRG